MNATAKKIEALQARLKQLHAQQNAAEARQKAAMAVAKRRRETRQKILLGAFVLQSLGEGGAPHLTLKGQSFDQWLTRTGDRAAFGLPGLEEAARPGGAE